MKTLRLSKKEAKTILENHAIKDLLKNKIFYSLNEFIKEYDICDFNLAIQSALFVKEKLNSLSFPSRHSFRIYMTREGEIKEIFANNLGFMLVLCEIAKNIKDKEKSEFCTNLAQYIKIETQLFYPEKRALARLEYTDITKEFRHEVKQFLDNYGYYSISSDISLLYNEILQGYYHLSKEDLNMTKTGSYTVSYLDHITAKELKDLTEIHKKVIVALQDSIGEAMRVARSESEERRVRFYTNFAGCYPDEYRSHTLKPAKMVKEFDKILKSYNLDAISINEYNLSNEKI